MNENNSLNNNPKKPFPKKFAVILSCVLIFILAAGGVTAFILLNREPPASLTEDNGGNDKNENENGIKSDEDITSGNPDSNSIDASAVISRVEILPTRATSGGVEIDTDFIVKTGAPVKISELSGCIALKSGDRSYEYGLRESETDGEYIMLLDAPLKYDSVYRIEYTEGENRPVSFAFQTVENFRVINTTPGNDGYGVPVNSGIEITFNERIEGELKDYFKISPYVKGKFENVGNTYIFISDGLIPGTNYDITVQKGLKSSESEKILEEDYSFSFWTQWGDAGDSVSIYGSAYETFLPDEEIFIQITANGVFLEKSYNVDIYELNNPEDYLNGRKFPDSPESVADLKRVGSLETELLNIEINSYYSVSYIMLNQKLPNGWYIIKIFAENNGKIYDIYKFIQVSPLSVYSATIDGEMLFWINDTITGLPAIGAEITTAEGRIATNSDGLATMDTKNNISGASVTIKYADYPQFVYETSSRAPADLNAQNRYYCYVYTDRKAYRPSDTIDVFGVIRERYDEYKITESDEITLKIGDMISIPVTLDKYGSFNVKIPIKDLSGYLNLNLYFNGEAINYNYINIVDYDNAKYAVGAKTDRSAYRPGENAEITISAEFYDGTSAEGVEVTRDNNTVGQTDGDGKATVTEYIQRFSNLWRYGWEPYTSSVYYNIGKTENKIQYIYVPYVIIPSDIMLEHEIISKSEIAFTSNFIERAAIESKLEESWYNIYSFRPDSYRGAVADVDFTVEIHRTEIIRTKTGERYDYINKINVPVYEYRSEETIAGTYNLSTVNGKISVSGLPVSDSIYINYYAAVSFKDTENNQIEFNIWYQGYGWNYYDQSSIKNYYFGVYNNNNENIYRLKLNETGYVKLQEYTNTQQITDGKLLAVLCHGKNKIISSNIGSPDGTPVTFTKDCVSNVRVLGAYFDGKYIYPITYGTDIYYDYDEKTLDFDVSFDKDSYVPGDEVTAEIKVTDENGNPKKTLVNISVVDESVFAEYDNNANMPAGFYNSIHYYIYYDYYASYTQHEFSSNNGGAEKGGGGGDDYSIRKDFTDNPAFISVETDESGIAKISFKLAEKITSWRVTVHGITEDNYVGNAKKNIISSLPFSIDLVMNSEYISGDDISVTVKPQGTKYKYNQTDIKYNYDILSGDNIITSGTGESKGNYNFNAGKLPEGSYKLRVTAEITAEDGNVYGDGMEKDFDVINSGVLLSLKACDVVSESSPTLREYNIKTSPVTVTMSNYDMDFIMRTLSSCVNYASKRTDYLAANTFSRKFTESIYNKTPLNIYPSDYYDLGYTADHDGKSELLYGSSDLLYTARFYACFPEGVMDFDKNNLRNYIYNACLLYNGNQKGLKNMTPEFEGNEYLELNRAAGYLTLAAIGDSVLLDIYEQINIIYNSKDQDKFTESYQSYMRILYYAAALCALGDDYTAAELIGHYTISGELYAPDQATKDMQSEYISTMKLYINTRIDPDEAYNYLKERGSLSNIYVSEVCEKINFVRYFTFKGGTRSEIEYTLDGETHRAVFENYDMTELILTKEQFAALNIKQISGNTAVNLSFYGAPENLDADKNNIYIEKQILSRDEYIASGYSDGNAADESAYYIVFKLKLSAGESYAIRDRLPGNMRYVGSSNNDNNYNNNYYVSNPEKQFIDISVYSRHGGEMTVVYNAVKISDADAVTEKAYISRNFDIDDVWGASK